jgi:hypothetical protein
LLIFLPMSSLFLCSFPTVKKYERNN